MSPAQPLRVAVVGAGWAGLAAAVRATEAGHRVSLFEMSPQWGGRARGVEVQGMALDNGQHILIGAYLRTLALMRSVGVEPAEVLHRQPLELRHPDGRGLRLPTGPAWLVFAIAVMQCKGWNWRERRALLRTAAGWTLARFRCPDQLSVAELCNSLPAAVRELLIDPLCVAALNTPARDASAAVFLRVLRDALFSGKGSSDLLLPRRPLAELVPGPAVSWLASRGAELHLSVRAQALTRQGAKWHLDGRPFDRVILACTAREAARLARPHAPSWSDIAGAMSYEPIVTVYLRCPGARLPCPMMALSEGPQAPAQFAFDHGALGASPGVFAFAVSGAGAWVERGLDATAAAVLDQALRAFPAGTWPQPPSVLQTMAEKRATFSCSAGLQRPLASIAPGLLAAGDYVAGPYPATLEGAVLSGEAAASSL